MIRSWRRGVVAHNQIHFSYSVYCNHKSQATTDYRKGNELQLRGPLNIARPIQGWPVTVQAGQSELGNQLAAETADVVFCSPKDLESAKTLYADIKGRAEA